MMKGDGGAEEGRHRTPSKSKSRRGGVGGWTSGLRGIPPIFCRFPTPRAVNGHRLSHKNQKSPEMFGEVCVL